MTLADRLTQLLTGRVPNPPRSTYVPPEVVPNYFVQPPEMTDEEILVRAAQIQKQLKAAALRRRHEEVLSGERQKQWNAQQEEKRREEIRTDAIRRGRPGDKNKRWSVRALYTQPAGAQYYSPTQHWVYETVMASSATEAIGKSEFKNDPEFTRLYFEKYRDITAVVHEEDDERLG